MKQLKEISLIIGIALVFWFSKMYLDTNTSIIISFIVGSFGQLLLLTNLKNWSKEDWYKLLAVLVISSFPLFLTINRPFGQKVLGPTIIFTITIALFFEKRIISILNEKILLVINLITIYLILKNTSTNYLLLIYSIPTLFVIINAFVNKNTKRWQQNLLFFWYFVLIITIPILHFNLIDLFDILLATPKVNVYQSFALGTTFSFVVLNLFYLATFTRVLPDIGSTQYERLNNTFSRKIQDPKMFDKKYDETIQFYPLQAIFVLIFFTVVLTLNYFFNIIPDSLLLVLVLFLTALLTQKKN